MYCERCGKKINPGEICSCQRKALRDSQNNAWNSQQQNERPGKVSGAPRNDVWNSQRQNGYLGDAFEGTQNAHKRETQRRPAKRRGGNIYSIISFLLLILGAELFGYFWMGTDNFIEQIPIEFIVRYKKYVSYGILFAIFLCGVVCGSIARKKSSAKKIAVVALSLNLLSCIAVCAMIALGVYQNYEVIKLCKGEWTETSSQKITKAYSEAEWDDPLRMDIENAVLKRIDALQEEYTQKTTDYESVSSQLEAISNSGVAAVVVKAEDAKNYVEEVESERKASVAGVGNEPETQAEPSTERETEQVVTEPPTEKEKEQVVIEPPTEKETKQAVTEPATEQPETEPVTEKRSTEESIDSILNKADDLIAKGSTDEARKLLLQAYNTTKRPEIQEKLDSLSIENNSVQTENTQNNVQTETNNIPQSGIHRYEYCLLDGTWEDAYRACLTKGGHLVTFETQEEYDYVVQELNNRNQQGYIFFIGGRRDLDSRLYYWVDGSNNLIGTALNSADTWNAGCWLHDEPSFEDTTLGLQEHVLSIFYYDDLEKWVWNDVPNDEIGAIPSYSGKVGYICEYEN